MPSLDERVEVVLPSGRQGWYMLLKSEITFGIELQTVVLLSITIRWSKIRTNMIKQLRKSV
jgi:hypothetical protein